MIVSVQMNGNFFPSNDEILSDLRPWNCTYFLSLFLINATTYEFSVIHKFENVDILVLLKFENRKLSHFNLSSKHYGKCKFTLKLIWLLIVSNLFILEIVQKGNVANFVH